MTRTLTGLDRLLAHNLQQLHIPVPAPRYPLRCPTLSYPTESEAHAHPLPVFPATTVFFPCLVQRGVHR